MLSKFRSRLTYANIVSSLCLFLVLGGGTAFAVTALDDNSVFSRHIVNGEVKNPDIGANAVGTGKVADNSLKGNDVNDGSLAGADLADGAVGTSQLQDLGVTTPKLADGAVTSDKLASFAVRTGNILLRQVTNSRIGTDAVDKRTIKADQVEASELAGVFHQSVEQTVPGATSSFPVREASINVFCPEDAQIISGGFRRTAGTVTFTESVRSGAVGWRVAAQNKSAAPAKFVAEAYCLAG